MAPFLAGPPPQRTQTSLRSWLAFAVLTSALTLAALFVIRLVRPAALDGVLASSGSADVRRAQARINIKWIQEALLVYAHDHAGAYPSKLDVLVEPGASGKTYFGERRELPLDPWERAFQYEPPTAEHPSARIVSLGADGKPGGTGEDADIDSDALLLDR